MASLDAKVTIDVTVTSTVPHMMAKDLTVSQARSLITPSNEDKRGDLTILFHTLAGAIAGVNFEVKQILCSRSKANVLRGMHAQARAPQAKIVTCLHGRVFDVIYDCRPGSPTYGKHDIVLLDSPEHSVYVPAGCLHGFYAPEEATVVYAADKLYDPASDGGVRWDTLGIPWPSDNPVVSDKDATLGTLSDWRHRCSKFYTGESHG